MIRKMLLVFKMAFIGFLKKQKSSASCLLIRVRNILVDNLHTDLTSPENKC